ncbi:MAG: hypothetical protein HOY44_12170 [Maritimibacter sp.]|uniref:hypothetical protein n=1 Tax=Maritimibacter sp. TaxID=2003363 RepID=UPI001E0CA398|nr:hypothetical protein [Maritimibacter sp.]MBL6428276.1 hypothetical protein [Maritimibacter sp.]
MRYPFFLALLVAGAPVSAQDMTLFVSGPDACAVVAGTGGDGGPIHALGPDNNILDYERIWGGAVECAFDGRISLDPDGGPEQIDGTCFAPDEPELSGTFDIVYSARGMTVVTFSHWSEPKVFMSCATN